MSVSLLFLFRIMQTNEKLELQISSVQLLSKLLSILLKDLEKTEV
jgi:hypothetical protein